MATAPGYVRSVQDPERDRLATEAAALETDDEDRAEVLAVARLMASLQPSSGVNQS
jgi:hypothetical protein